MQNPVGRENDSSIEIASFVMAGNKLVVLTARSKLAVN